MDFGKLPDISKVDFSMPSDPQGTEHLLSSTKRQGRVFLGVSAWADRAYCGHFYPSATKPAAYLTQYARQFDTVELNATHYGIPTERQLENWAAQVPDQFRFCPKIPQLISHRPDLGLKSGVLENYLDVIGALGNHLGIQFLQLPPEFGPDKLALLEQLLTIWPREFQLAVEFRHPGWFTNDDTWQVLRTNQEGTVITDVAGRRDVLHMQLTMPFVMIRFVGNALHKTDFQRLANWISRVQKWYNAGVDVYFMPHQPQATELIKMSFEVATKFLKAGIAIKPLVHQETAVQGKLF